MSPTLIALMVFIILGLGLSFWLLNRNTAASASGNHGRGANQLSQLRWRDFAKLVLQAMQSRGYRPVIEPGAPQDGIPTDGGDILLQRDDELTLLSCKYGSASVVRAQAMLGLKQSASLRGANHVLVVTPGQFDEDAVRVAEQQQIELIDGQALWPELRPYVSLPNGTQATTSSQSATAARGKPLAIAWSCAAAAAVIAWMIAQGLSSPAPASPDPTAVSGSSRAAPATSAPAVPAPMPSQVPTDPIQLEKRRADVAASISTLFGVERAIWSTQSTLLVYLTAQEADPSNQLCPLLERYPELAASRVQLQPPAGSTRPVRFKQCRSY